MLKVTILIKTTTDLDGLKECKTNAEAAAALWWWRPLVSQHTLYHAVSANVKESGKVILGPHSNQHRNLITLKVQSLPMPTTFSRHA